jgi:hypothetical protein
MAETGMVTLVCGWCGRKRQMWADQWARHKAICKENGTALVCDKPVPGTKLKCTGFLEEEKAKDE